MPFFPKVPASLFNSFKAKYIHTIRSPNLQTHDFDCTINNSLYNMSVKPNIRVCCTFLYMPRWTDGPF